jgi:hypothetical protein
LLRLEQITPTTQTVEMRDTQTPQASYLISNILNAIIQTHYKENAPCQLSPSETCPRPLTVP